MKDQLYTFDDWETWTSSKVFAKIKYLDIGSRPNIEWTSGSDKSHGEAIYEYWENKLDEAPTERNFRRVRNQKKALENNIERLETEHKKMQDDHYVGEEPALDKLELIDLYKDALDHLTYLIENHQKDSSDGITAKQKETAIQLVVDNVDKKMQCQKSLNEYIELKQKDPKRSVLDIHDEIDDGDLTYSSLNNWVNSYKKKINALIRAQEK